MKRRYEAEPLTHDEQLKIVTEISDLDVNSQDKNSEREMFTCQRQDK